MPEEKRAGRGTSTPGLMEKLFPESFSFIASKEVERYVRESGFRWTDEELAVLISQFTPRAETHRTLRALAETTESWALREKIAEYFKHFDEGYRCFLENDGSKIFRLYVEKSDEGNPFCGYFTSAEVALHYMEHIRNRPFSLQKYHILSTYEEACDRSKQGRVGAYDYDENGHAFYGFS